jgi:hypothetical protein
VNGVEWNGDKVNNPQNAKLKEEFCSEGKSEGKGMERK